MNKYIKISLLAFMTFGCNQSSVKSKSTQLKKDPIHDTIFIPAGIDLDSL